VTAVCLSPDGRHVFTGSRDGLVRLWEVSTHRCLHTFPAALYGVQTLAVSPDGRQVAACCAGIALLWQLAAGGAPRTAPLVLSRISSGRELLEAQQAYGSVLKQAEQALAREDAVAALRLLRQARAQPGHERERAGLDAWGILYRRLPLGAFRDCWPVLTLNIACQRADSMKLAFSAGGRLLLGAGWSQWQLFDLPAGRCLRRLGAEDKVSAAVLSPDGSGLLAAHHEVGVKCLDVGTGVCMGVLEEQDSVRALSLCPAGRFALCGGSGGVRLWDLKSGRELRALAAPGESIHSLRFSSDGRLAIALGSPEKRSVPRCVLRVWDLTQGRCLRQRVVPHEERLQALSPDGRWALWSRTVKPYRVWVDNLRTGKTRSVLTGGGHVTAGWFSPDGSRVLADTFGCANTLWDAASGRIVRPLTEGLVEAAAFRGDGRVVATAGEDRAVALWDAETGACLRTLTGPTDKVQSLHFSPDACHLAALDVSGRCIVWFLDWDLQEAEPTDDILPALPLLETFLALHSRTPEALSRPAPGWLARLWRRLTGGARGGPPKWTEEDFQRLLFDLGCAGLGCLRPEGVRRELEKRAATLQGAS
jgi:WD40 repeat protein